MQPFPNWKILDTVIYMEKTMILLIWFKIFFHFLLHESVPQNRGFSKKEDQTCYFRPPFLPNFFTFSHIVPKPPTFFPQTHSSFLPPFILYPLDLYFMIYIGHSLLRNTFQFQFQQYHLQRHTLILIFGQLSFSIQGKSLFLRKSRYPSTENEFSQGS